MQKLPLVAETCELRDLRDFFRNIEEQEDSWETVLGESEERFRSFVCQCFYGVIIINDRGMILEWNEVEENMTGIPHSEAIGLPLWEVQYRLAPEEKKDPNFLASARKKIFNGFKEGLELKRVLEDKIQRSDGSRRVIQSVVFTIASGKEILAVGLSRDITEQKQKEETLRQQTLELRQLTDTIMRRIKKRTSELIEAQKIIAESRKRLRDLSIRLIEAQEIERRRIAGEIHDSLAAALGALRLRIDQIAEEMKIGHASPESLQDLASKVTQINSEVRRIMADLRPSVLDDLGIIAALNWFCREYRKSYSPVSVVNQIGVEEREVPDSLKTPIFRISQEAMNNIAKHSQASLVNFSLQKTDYGIELAIQDNGQGFCLDTAKKGMGLITMRERAQLSEGSFELQSAIGKGTTIRVSWPLAAASK
jgi:PAS domain S-box-containing protein